MQTHPAFALLAGHVVNLDRCQYLQLDDDTIWVAYPDDSLEITFDTPEEAAAALARVADFLNQRGSLVAATPSP